MPSLKNIARSLILLLLLSGSLFAFSLEPLFDGGITYTAGSEPGQIINWDVNGDGFIDLVVANIGANDSTVSVYINNGDGSFEDAVYYSTGGRIRAIATGDFYGDTMPDLAVLLYAADSVYFMINEGDTLRLDSVAFELQSDPMMLIGADLNGDGDTLLDIAAVNYTTGSLSILLNIYNGTFDTAVNYTTGSNPVDLCALYLDTNLSLDIAVAQAGDDSVTLFTNDGAGVMTIDTVIGLGDEHTPVAIDAGDFDNDGDGDLAVATADSGIIILYNNYSVDSFVVLQIRDNALSGIKDITIADIDNDSDVDIIAVGADGAVSVLYNQVNANDTSFGNVTEFGNNFAGNTLNSVCAADFNDDSNVDLAVSNLLTDNISVLFNFGNGVFPLSKNYPTDYCAFAAAGGQLDGDFGADLVVSNWSGKDVTMLINNGDSTFTSLVQLPINDNLGYICLGDFDFTNGLDMAVTNYNNDSVSVFLHTNIASPISTYISSDNYYAGPGPYEIQAADINADMMLDLVVGNYDSTTVAVLLGDGSGAFAAPVFYEAGTWPGHVKCYDYDGDNNIDIITTNYYEDSVMVLLNDGNGAFAAPFAAYAGDGPSTAFPADLDNDGDCDLVVTNYDSDSISILINYSTYLLTINSQLATGRTPTYVAAADFDMDGDSDLVVTNMNSNTISVYQNNSGTFAFDADYNVARGPRMVLPIDIDGDIDKDLVVCNCFDGMITVLLNRTTLPPIPTDVGDNPAHTALPDDYVLQANYPNPFNPSTTIKYALPERSHVTISIYNILGRKIATIVDDTKAAGEYKAVWDGRDYENHPVASGLYLYQIKTDKYTESRKMLLLK